MNTKEIIEKLKLTFNELVNNAAAPADAVPAAPADAAPAVEVEPTAITAKLKDGTEVVLTALEVGGMVTINGQPAPAGDHILEDGTVLTVGDNGVITAIVPTPSMEEEMKKKMSAFEDATNQKFAYYESKFAEYESKLEKAIKVIEVLNQFTLSLAEQPTGTPDPITNPATKFSAETDSKSKNYSLLFS